MRTGLDTYNRTTVIVDHEIPPCVMSQIDVITDRFSIANVFNRYYAKVHRKKKSRMNDQNANLSK